jgi:hypothetical protein
VLLGEEAEACKVTVKCMNVLFRMIILCVSIYMYYYIIIVLFLYVCLVKVFK